MEGDQVLKLTVQGLGTPVPAAEVSERAGSQPSTSSDCNDTVVANLATVSDTTTSAVEAELLTAFKRGNKLISRSPPKKDLAMNGKSRDSTRSVSIAEDRSSPKRNSAMLELGRKIEELQKMFGDGRRTIHQPLRDLVKSIAALQKRAMAEQSLIKGKVDHGISQFSQTSPSLTVIDGEKIKRRRSHNTEEPKLPSSKKSKTVSSPRTALANTEREVGENELGTRMVENESESTEPISALEWKTVRKKNRRTKTPMEKPVERSSDTRRKFTRPDALVISKTRDMSYADILKNMKANPELKEFGENITKIRKTAKGELLFELKRRLDSDNDNLRERAAVALNDMGSVRMISQEVLLECRDLDEVTTREEICDAIRNEFPSVGIVQQSAIKHVRVARDGTQTALISLPVRSANILIAAGRIRIGWVRCRLRERFTPTRCLKCLDYGHVARHCKSEVDRTGLCFRCGNKGHIAKNCKNQAKCVLCQPDYEGGNEHPTGNIRCSAYKRAIATATTRNG